MIDLFLTFTPTTFLDFGGELGCLSAGMGDGWGQLDKGLGSVEKSRWVP